MDDEAEPIELWGGVECTVNRVGDRYRDQLRLSGHHDRLDDLDRFAALGIRTLRYPVLWERTAPAGEPDWTWPDERLHRIRALGMRPIVGLVHHGSGPPHTHLLDDGFAAGLGRHAGAVAARYPWVEAWTPVNEPLTTARFAALYGHWYPHAAGERAFWLALLNQVDATRAAMTAIRRIIPAAQLVQTEDFGRTYATDALAEQAAFDNLRRWASWDLLFGHVDTSHPLFARLHRMGLGDRLRAIADDPCPPDIVGVNHYLTSDRFLDHRLDRYPPHLHGGNERMRYADTEALRARRAMPAGLGGALRETWQRYRTPIAVTEVHNGCTRDEQLRWAAQAWDTARAVAAEGAEIRAVTAWALLGSHGWDTLLTADGRYEPGLFDVADGVPRETALAALWRGLPLDAPRHPVALEPGWWQRPDRLIYGEPLPPTENGPGRPLLICGEAGRSREAIVEACAARAIRHMVVDQNAATATLLRTSHAWGVFGTDRHAIVARACATARIPFSTLPTGAEAPAKAHALLDALIDRAA
jgi:dTDP-4-dehydrorhamnose reductase